MKLKIENKGFIGQTLPNGARLVAISKGDSVGIIMATTDTGEYATWEFNGRWDNTYWGHYFKDDRKACLSDFLLRTKAIILEH